ncbi:hypothetical protein NC652_003950 [Populus alba x Populus x berolinensis]|nr:hypothetical protein NC652_003950 [Populus alba x Populus x berolinensis]
MNFPLSTLVFTLLVVSFSHLNLHSSLAMEKLEDTGNTKKKSSNLKVKFLVNFQSFAYQGDHVQRKYLHEVHSGPNLISNSVSP